MHNLLLKAVAISVALLETHEEDWLQRRYLIPDRQEKIGGFYWKIFDSQVWLDLLERRITRIIREMHA